MSIDIITILLSSLGSATLVGAALWLTRNLMITRLTAAVGHEYDEKLAVINANLTSKETEIEALRNGVLSGVVNRQRVLYERRLVAVEQLWDNVLTLAPAKHTSITIFSIPYDKFLEHAEKDPKVQEMFKMIDGATDGKKDLSFLKQDNAIKARPFLSELAWALFSAYHAILSMAIFRMEMLKTGINLPLQKSNTSLDIIKKALPHHTDYIDKYGLDGLHHLLEELELSILRELRRILDGKDSDNESIELAKSINEAVKESLSSTTSESK